MAMPVLAGQAFAGSVLDRSIAERRDVGFLQDVLPHARVLLVAGNECCVAGGEEGSSLRWLGAQELRQLGVESRDGTLLFKRRGGDTPLAVVPFLLGRESGRSQQWRLAADASAARPSLHGLAFQPLRSLMGLLPPADLAVAGHAVALSQWHAANPFCSRCGAPNKQIEAGGKVQCTANEKHRAYPRTDPVAIMVIEDEAGGRALLGRPRQLRTGVLTCLSGFVEQGESIEEAVRREVLEEAGVRVGPVAILGSQPWPIGRGGSCELMVGCVGKALASDLAVDAEEMADVRWVSREDVRAAVEASEQSRSFDSKSTAPGLDFFIPPKWAIAHHLIKAWAQAEQPWFPSKL